MIIRVSNYAYNQLVDLRTHLCDYRTKGEYGRSAFWIWYDKIQNEVRSLRTQYSKRLPNGEYKYTMKYWGKIFFKVVYGRRSNGRFTSNTIVITDFEFNEVNLYNWLQHKAPIEHKEPLPNVVNTKVKPSKLGLNYTKVAAQSGLFTVGDANGKPLNDKEWFKQIAPMRKTRKGEITTIVNIDGWAYIYYPQRDYEHHLEKTGKSYGQMVAESAFRKAFKESLNELCNKKMLTESYNMDGTITIDKDDIRCLVRNTLIKRAEILESKGYNGYQPIGYNKSVTLNNGTKIISLMSISDGAGRYDIGEDDGCYVVYQDKEHESAMYIFPELHKALKRLPNLPLT